MRAELVLSYQPRPLITASLNQRHEATLSAVLCGRLRLSSNPWSQQTYSYIIVKERDTAELKTLKKLLFLCLER